MLVNEKENNFETDVIKNIKKIEQQLIYFNSLFDNKNDDILQKKINEENYNDIREEIQTIDSKINEEKEYEKIEKEEQHLAYEFVQNVQDNCELLISEKKGKVFLPYTIDELKAYMVEYPEEYNSLSDVVNKEYIQPIKRYKNSKFARFREAYALMRDVEMKSIIESIKGALKVFNDSRINPAVIAACKSEEQLNKYIYCLEHGALEQFNDFKIIFDFAPFHSTNNNIFDFDFEKYKAQNEKGGKRCM